MPGRVSASVVGVRSTPSVARDLGQVGHVQLDVAQAVECAPARSSSITRACRHGAQNVVDSWTSVTGELGLTSSQHGGRQRLAEPVL